MDRLKQALMEAEGSEATVVTDRVEVIGPTIASCLNRAGQYLATDLSMLDYEVLQRGKRSFLNPQPYRLLVTVLPEQNRFADLEEFSVKLGVKERLLSDDLEKFVTPKHQDGRSVVRVYRNGVFITVFPPLGEGRPVDMNQALLRLRQAGVERFDQGAVDRAVAERTGEPVRLAEWVPKPENDSTVKVDITPDEMKAYVKITPPRHGGRHLEVDDVVHALKSYGIVIGFQENAIRDALLNDRYMEEILAAQGQPPKHGRDAYVDYKVSIGKEQVKYEEDSKGRVDFKQMNLIENVVVGQILAEKIPAEDGVMGRTLLNRIVEARDGKDIELKQGRGTILSEDRTRLIAEINGQVVFANGKLSVEPVHRVSGDVGPKTGNIMFLGSVIITGNVLDNYEVKAAGNVEVSGAVQMARIEAEGDIIIKQGILGRDAAHIESTGGSLHTKFIQSAEVFVAGDVVVQEGILHSRVEAGQRIICNGRRAQIVGGQIRATKEVRAKMIGAAAGAKTEVTVGTDPRILAQFEELQKMKLEEETALSKDKKEIATLEARKRADPEAFSEEHEETLQKKLAHAKKQDAKIADLGQELQRIEEYMQEIGAEGKVHVEKEIFPGVVVTIKDYSQNISDSYRQVTLTYDNGYVKIGKLEKDDTDKARSWRSRR